VTPIQAVRHAWAAVREAADSGSREVDDEQLDSIEPGIRLLELSAAYRAAHAAFEAAPEGEHLEPLRAMNAARDALLSAALDIT